MATHRLKRGLCTLATCLLILTLCRPARAQNPVYPYFAPGGALGGSATSQTINLGAGSSYVLGNLNLSLNGPSIATSTILGNYSGSTGTPQVLNPLAVANMLSAVIAVDVVANSNITLSGAATIDGVVLANGNFVLAQDQTTQSQNGIWVVNTSGAWTRPANFPSGYVIATGCELIIYVRLGTASAGNSYYIPTTSPITIGTTAFQPLIVPNQGSSSKFGIVKLGGASGDAAAVVSAVQHNFDCVAGASGGILDFGDANNDTGYCTVESQSTGHIILSNSNGNFSSPSASAGTLSSNWVDNWGVVTGLSGATSVVITFGQSFASTASCTANDSAGTAVGVTPASNGASVTFSMTALTGSFSYHCFGQE